MGTGQEGLRAKNSAEKRENSIFKMFLLLQHRASACCPISIGRSNFQIRTKSNVIHRQNRNFMRYLLLFMLLVGVFVIGKHSCFMSIPGFGGVHGEGPVKTETRDISGFHALDLDLSGDVDVSISDQYSVEVSAQGNLLPLLKTEIVDGKLRIYFEGSVSTNEPVHIRVSAPAFDAMEVSGSGKITTITPIKSDQLKLAISGSGDLVLPQTDLRDVSVEIGGSGTVEIGGTANQLDVQVSGSGDVKGKNLTTAICKAEINGSGSVTCDVSQKLDAHVSGSGDVFYTGNPEVQMDVAGSGSVKKI